MKVIVTESQLKLIIRESGGWDDATTNEEWLEWKEEREHIRSEMGQYKKHVLSTVMKFNRCLNASKQSLLDEYPNVRMASQLSWETDIESLMLKEETYVQRELRRMSSPDYNPQSEIDGLEKRAEENKRKVFQQVRDRHERRKKNLEHLKPVMRLYRAIEESLFMTERVEFHQNLQGVSGIHELLESTQFLLNHENNVAPHIVNAINGCVSRLEEEQIEESASNYVHMEKQWFDMLDRQPTQIVRH